MKKKFFLPFGTLLIVSALLFSCSDEENQLNLSNDNDSTTSKFIPEPIKIPSKWLGWDESYHPNEGLTTKSSVNHSHEIAVTSGNLYVGAPYTAKSVETLGFQFIPNAVKPIEVAYTFPRYYFDRIERPSVTGMYRSLSQAIESPNFTGKQSLSFEYDFREFSYRGR